MAVEIVVLGRDQCLAKQAGDLVRLEDKPVLAVSRKNAAYFLRIKPQDRDVFTTRCADAVNPPVAEIDLDSAV